MSDAPAPFEMLSASERKMLVALLVGELAASRDRALAAGADACGLAAILAARRDRLRASPETAAAGAEAGGAP